MSATRRCRAPGCPALVKADGTGRCPTHEREHEAARGTTTERGYGADHQAERARWQYRLDHYGSLTCVLCGKPIRPADLWHLDHTPDRVGYRGPAHRYCNTSDGGKRARH